jgi:Kef-type K+ transport system membrane component KefB
MPHDPILTAPFTEIALLLAIAAAAGALAVRLRQPVLIAYIIVGIVVGPAVLGIVQMHDQIELLAQIGVAVLLFVVGLKLDLTQVRQIGPVALATGLGQLAFTILLGFGLIVLLGKSYVEALYVAVALTFSSTIIIVKLLSDKRELDSLHGRIAVGFLIVQDIAVVIAMMAMSAMRGAGDASPLDVAGSLLLRIASAAVAMYVLMRYVLPATVRAMARSQDLLLLFAIAWGVGLAALGEWAGFSKEAGAFLAGFSLASSSYREAMSARLAGIRDFLLLFFFVDLGARLDFAILGDAIWPATVLSAFVLVGNPLIVMAIMGYMGYRRRTGFLAGLTVAQISEFSIVFVAMGISLGHVGTAALGLTTLVGIVTITLSTYMILYSQALYDRVGRWLRPFERRIPFRELEVSAGAQESSAPRVIVFGLGRYGSRLAHQLRADGLSVLGIDFDPEVARAHAHEGFPVRFGDAQDLDFVDGLPLDGRVWIVSTLPDLESNRTLLHALRTRGAWSRAAFVARDDSQARQLAESGAGVVIHPFRDAADFVGARLSRLIRKEEEEAAP